MPDLVGAPSLPVGVHLATCVGFRGPVPTKATKFYTVGRMQAVIDFRADIAPQASVASWSNWPWNIDGWPPVLNGNVRIPSESEIATFSLALRANAATPQGDITLYGLLRALGGIVQVDSVNFKTDTAQIIGKRCKIEMAARQSGGTYIKNVFVDQEALTSLAPALAPAPATVGGAFVTADLVMFAQATFAALKAAGVDENELRTKLTARGAQKVAFLKTDQSIIELVMDWAELAASADKTSALPELPNTAWAPPLVTMWQALKTPGEV